MFRRKELKRKNEQNLRKNLENLPLELNQEIHNALTGDDVVDVILGKLDDYIWLNQLKYENPHFVHQDKALSARKYNVALKLRQVIWELKSEISNKIILYQEVYTILRYGEVVNNRLIHHSSSEAVGFSALIICAILSPVLVMQPLMSASLTQNLIEGVCYAFNGEGELGKLLKTSIELLTVKKALYPGSDLGIFKPVRWFDEEALTILDSPSDGVNRLFL